MHEYNPYNHYLVEKDLANKLLNSSKTDRTGLYNRLYTELFQKINNHPQIKKKSDKKLSTRKVKEYLPVINNYTNKDSIFLDIGAGDCTLSKIIAKKTKLVYALEVSNEFTKIKEKEPNLKIILYDGCKIPIPDEVVNIAFSNQVIEHIHPEDIYDHLREIYRTVKPKGVFIFQTPNRLSGPHDISRNYDDIATGFHLKEYTCEELIKILKEIGFNKFNFYIFYKGLYSFFPITFIIYLERFLKKLPKQLSKEIARNIIIGKILSINLICHKL